MKLLQDNQFKETPVIFANLNNIIDKFYANSPFAKRIHIQTPCPSCGKLTYSFYECGYCQLIADRQIDEGR